MTDTTLIELSRAAPRANPLGAFARQLVFVRLATLRAGRLRIREGNEVYEFGSPQTVIDATVTVLDPAFYSEIAFGGSVGAGATNGSAGASAAPDLTGFFSRALSSRASSWKALCSPALRLGEGSGGGGGGGDGKASTLAAGWSTMAASRSTLRQMPKPR